MNSTKQAIDNYIERDDIKAPVTMESALEKILEQDLHLTDCNLDREICDDDCPTLLCKKALGLD